MKQSQTKRRKPQKNIVTSLHTHRCHYLDENAGIENAR